MYTLLPPPYRVVWLEWQDAETAAKKEAKQVENKVRITCCCCFCLLLVSLLVNVKYDLVLMNAKYLAKIINLY